MRIRSPAADVSTGSIFTSARYESRIRRPQLFAEHQQDHRLRVSSGPAAEYGGDLGSVDGRWLPSEAECGRQACRTEAVFCNNGDRDRFRGRTEAVHERRSPHLTHIVRATPVDHVVTFRDTLEGNRMSSRADRYRLEFVVDEPHRKGDRIVFRVQTRGMPITAHPMSAPVLLVIVAVTVWPRAAAVSVTSSGAAAAGPAVNTATAVAAKMDAIARPMSVFTESSILLGRADRGRAPAFPQSMPDHDFLADAHGSARVPIGLPIGPWSMRCRAPACRRSSVVTRCLPARHGRHDGSRPQP